MSNIVHNIGVAAQIGSYSDAIEVPPDARWLFTSGTPGLALDGELPADITGQAEIAWEPHCQHAQIGGYDGATILVKVTHYLLHERDIPDYVKVRSRFLGDARPASMLLTGAGLVRTEFLLEIEAIAAKV